MSDIKLKPCPFCLSETPQIHSDGGCQYFKVHCYNCNCTKTAPYDDDTENGAVKSWNKRIVIEE